MPGLYVKFINNFSFLNVVLLPHFLECEAQFDHYDRVIMLTVGPPIVAALGWICWAAVDIRMHAVMRLGSHRI